MRRRFRLSDRFVEEHQLLDRRLQAIGEELQVDVTFGAAGA